MKTIDFNHYFYFNLLKYLMTLSNNQTVCQLINKGYFSQAKDRIISINADVNDIDQDGRTSLMLCAFIDESIWSISLARFLLQFGARISMKDKINEMNVIHYCCIFEQVDLLNVLLDSVDFDINVGDLYGNSALIYAIVINNSAIIDSLITFYQRYKINVDKLNIKGINALMQASLSGNIELIKQLIEMGANENIRDIKGKSANQYKEDAISKLNIISQFNDNRRQSRMVRFDDIELILKLQQENINLRQDASKISEINDPNLEIIRAIQLKVKRLRRNKIDFLYVSKSMKNVIEYNKNVAIKNDLNIKKIRPKTSMETKESLFEKNNWYSFIGPLFVTLEQQCTPSFRVPIKRKEFINPQETLTANQKQRSRKLSLSTVSVNTRHLSSCRLTINDEKFDSQSVIHKSKKRDDDNVSFKGITRNFSRARIRSAASSINNGY